MLHPDPALRRYLFGPVPSRRLGRSLGVDLTPMKTCSFDCIFCQLGRTTNKTLERRVYVPVADVVEELRDWVKREGSADYISLSGSGEPTLHADFGSIIDSVRTMTNIPVALLTNTATFGDPEVRAAAAQAQVVKLSLSAWDQSSLAHVNRPCPAVEFEAIVEGQRRFRAEFKGQLWLEVVLLWGTNTARADVGRIASIVKTIRPDRVQLNTAVRPPAEDFAIAVPRDHLVQLARLFDPPAEVIADYASGLSPKIKAGEEDIFAMLLRRPCTSSQIASAFAMHANEVAKYLGKLMETGHVTCERRNEHVYYVADHGKDVGHANV